MKAQAFALPLLMAFCLSIPNLAFSGTLVIGQVGPVTGLLAQTGRDYQSGVQLYFDGINGAGGVNGNTLKLVHLDDSGNAESNEKLTRQLIAAEKPLALIGYVGTESARKIAKSEILKKEGIPLIGFRSGELRSEPNFFNVRASFKEEISKLVQQCKLAALEPRMALIYDPVFADAETIKMVEDTIQKYGLKLVAKEDHSKKIGSVEERSHAILQAKPGFVFLLMDGSKSAAFVESFSLLPKPPQLLLTSETDLEILMRRLGNDQARGIILAQVLPDPYAATSRITREFKLAASKPGTKVRISYTSLEGYIAAKVLVEAIRRAGPKINRKTLVASLENLGEFDLGGYVIEFQPGRREGSKFVELSLVNKEGKLTH